MSEQPNLFDYATKELSQDAMICWLLKWANAEHRARDAAICEVGRQLVRALLAKHGLNLSEAVDTVEVWKQRHKIDVLALVNGKHLLLIEDKTDTRDHGDQLCKYIRAVEGDAKFQDAEIYPIYFKTGNYSQRNERDRIEGPTAYKFFDRRDFLDVLDKHREQEDIDNAILKDFTDHLQRREKRTNSYRLWTEEDNRDDWGTDSWSGLFKDLERRLDGSEWGHVHNRRGGFLGFWWGGTALCGEEHKGASAYMQLEVVTGDAGNQHLCFKLGAHAFTKDKERQSWLKNYWHRQITNDGKETRVSRPARMRRGDTMTVAIWKGDWLKYDNGKLDLDATVQCLKEAESVLKEAVGRP